MALPQKVIEQINREPVPTPGWSSRLLMLGLTFFIVPLLIYAGITFGYKPYLQNQLNTLNDRIAQASQAIPQSDQNKVRVFYAQLTNVKTLLDKHVATSKLFKWLERNTLLGVYFDRLTLQNGATSVTFSGNTKSIDEFVEQARRFEIAPEVKQAAFQNITVSDKGIWHFDVTVVFDPTFWLQVSPVTATSSVTQ